MVEAETETETRGRGNRKWRKCLAKKAGCENCCTVSRSMQTNRKSRLHAFTSGPTKCTGEQHRRHHRGTLRRGHGRVFDRTLDVRSPR